MKYIICMKMRRNGFKNDVIKCDIAYNNFYDSLDDTLLTEAYRESSK